MFLMVSPTSDVAIGEAHETLVRGVFAPPVRVAGALAANLWGRAIGLMGACAPLSPKGPYINNKINIYIYIEYIPIYIYIVFIVYIDNTSIFPSQSIQ